MNWPKSIVAFGGISAAVYRAALGFGEGRKLKETRRRAEGQIREQTALLDQAGDAIAVLDLDGRLLFWNKGAERIYGWTATEVLGQRVEDLVGDAAWAQKGDGRGPAASTPRASLPAEPSPAALSPMRQAQQCVLQAGEWSGELRHRTKAGKAVVLASRWSLVRDDQDRPQSILVIGTDVTERKQLEAQLRRAQRLESIGTLAGGIAHDLNNVLTPIIMATDLLKLKRPDEATLKLLQTIEASAKRGAGLVKQLLTFARGHEGERCLLSLAPLVKEVINTAAETFPKSIRLRARFADGLWAVSADATQLHQALLNLCVNARDAMPDGGEMLIAAENCEVTPAQARAHLNARPGKYIRLSVTDTGSGIPPEVMERMFEPFFTTKQSGRGTGLGLATVLSIVKGHQGFLDVQSQVGQGTTVCIYLPAVEVAPTEAGTPQTASRVERRAGTVLVVDDEASIRQMLQVSLGARGWRVLTACNGAEALSAVSEHADELDAVVLDMMMPVMDGATALPLLRKLKPDLRFVLISGLRQADTLREQVGDADVTFLQKPFSLDKLEEAMRGSALSGGSQPTVPCGAVGRGVCAPLRTDGPAAAAVD